MTPVEAVAAWVDEVVVGLNLCPFAAGPLQRGRVRWISAPYKGPRDLADQFLGELDHLVGSSVEELSTTLLVLHGDEIEADFELFLDLAGLCEDLLEETGSDALVQLATFHPHYLFAESEPDDPANATNRAPYPVIHLLRVDEVEEAIERHGDIDALLERNQALMRSR